MKKLFKEMCVNFLTINIIMFPIWMVLVAVYFNADEISKVFAEINERNDWIEQCILETKASKDYCEASWKKNK